MLTSTHCESPSQVTKSPHLSRQENPNLWSCALIKRSDRRFSGLSDFWFFFTEISPLQVSKLSHRESTQNRQQPVAMCEVCITHTPAPRHSNPAERGSPIWEHGKDFKLRSGNQILTGGGPQGSHFIYLLATLIRYQICSPCIGRWSFCCCCFLFWWYRILSFFCCPIIIQRY